MNPERKTMAGKWVTTDRASVPPGILAAHAAAGVDFPEASCVFSGTLKTGDKRPVRYEQVSEQRRNPDGTCEADFDVGDPAPDSLCPDTGPDPNSGNGNGGGNGGLTAGFADPVRAPVTKLWVQQSFTYDGTCVYGQNAWPGAWQLVQTGWVDTGYTFSRSQGSQCPTCAQRGGFMEPTYAQITNSSFYNATFCLVLTGKPGVTFNDYTVVEDYGFADFRQYGTTPRPQQEPALDCFIIGFKLTRRPEMACEL